MITESKCSPSERMNSLKRCEPSSSAGFGGTRPDVSSQRPMTLLLRMHALGAAWPTIRLDSPGSCFCLNMSCRRGQRMSASMRSTRWPACASPMARLAAINVLPSPGAVLVISSVRAPSAADENSTFVRIARIASANPGGTPLQMSGPLPCHEPGSIEGGHQPTGDQTQMGPNFLGGVDSAVHLLEEDCEPDRHQAAAEHCEGQIQELPWRGRLARPLGRVDDADVAGLELTADAGLFRALEQALVNLLAALDVAFEDAVIDRLPVHRLRFGLLLVERTSQAVFFRERCEVLVVDRLTDLGDFALQLRLRELNGRFDLDDVR